MIEDQFGLGRAYYNFKIGGTCETVIRVVTSHFNFAPSFDCAGHSEVSCRDAQERTASSRTTLRGKKKCDDTLSMCGSFLLVSALRQRIQHTAGLPSGKGERERVTARARQE